MIIEIPSSNDFERSSLNLLNLGWEIAAKSLDNYQNSTLIHPVDTPEHTILFTDGSTHTIGGPDTTFTKEERAIFAQEYWQKSQPSLGNALSLVQQAVEHSIKGKIAEVSPYLLIIRDGKEGLRSAPWDIPFSMLRSVDATDLLKLHNSVCKAPFDRNFQTLWEDIRRQRNLFIHSVAPSGDTFRPDEILKNIIVLSKYLHPGTTWFERRLHYASTDEIGVAYDVDEGFAYAQVLNEFETAFSMLSSPFLKTHFVMTAKENLLFAQNASAHAMMMFGAKV